MYRHLLPDGFQLEEYTTADGVVLKEVLKECKGYRRTWISISISERAVETPQAEKKRKADDEEPSTVSSHKKVKARGKKEAGQSHRGRTDQPTQPIDGAVKLLHVEEDIR